MKIKELIYFILKIPKYIFQKYQLGYLAFSAEIHKSITIRNHKNIFIEKFVRLNQGVVLWPGDACISIGEYTRI